MHISVQVNGASWRYAVELYRTWLARSPCLIAWGWSKGWCLGVTTNTILRSHVWKFLSMAVMALIPRETICRKIHSPLITPENYVSSLKNVTIHVHILCFSIPRVPHTWCEPLFSLLFWHLKCKGAHENWGFGRILLVNTGVPTAGRESHNLFWKHSFGLKNDKSVFIFLNAPKGEEKGKESLDLESIETREKKKAKFDFPNNLSSLILPSGHWVHFQSVFWKIKWIFHLTSCIPEYVTIQSLIKKDQKKLFFPIYKPEESVS